MKKVQLLGILSAFAVLSTVGASMAETPLGQDPAAKSDTEVTQMQATHQPDGAQDKSLTPEQRQSWDKRTQPTQAPVTGTEATAPSDK